MTSKRFCNCPGASGVRDGKHRALISHTLDCLRKQRGDVPVDVFYGPKFNVSKVA